MAINEDDGLDAVRESIIGREADYGKNDFSEFRSQWRESPSNYYSTWLYCTGCNRRAKLLLEIFLGDQNHAVYFCDDCIERMWQALTTERVKRRLLNNAGS